jgi:hypothetical protein
VYPLPNMLDFAAKAAGCTVFSKIDLRKGYHQIPVNPADVQKTAVLHKLLIKNFFISTLYRIFFTVFPSISQKHS